MHNPRVTSMSMTEYDYEEDVIGIRRPEFRGGGDLTFFSNFPVLTPRIDTKK